MYIRAALAKSISRPTRKNRTSKPNSRENCDRDARKRSSLSEKNAQKDCRSWRLSRSGVWPVRQPPDAAVAGVPGSWLAFGVG